MFIRFGTNKVKLLYEVTYITCSQFLSLWGLCTGDDVISHMCTFSKYKPEHQGKV
jgi:hypothetical protein